MKKSVTYFIVCCLFNVGYSQPDTIKLGFGNMHTGAMMSSSDPSSDPEKTVDHSGFLPNEAAAVAFLRQATLGYSPDDIQQVMNIGIEEWIDNQFNTPILYDLSDRVGDLHTYSINGSGDPDDFPGQTLWRSSWYDYHMKSPDLLRQRVAFALSEILVVSEFSNAGYSYGLADYYDRLLLHSYGNYRNLLQDITYSPTMGMFLTFMRNPKSNPTQNRFPDENYAREVMQLFTIGLYELNLDGSRKKDSDGNDIPTYDNADILEFAKIFTGLGWYGGNSFWSGTSGTESWTNDMIMYNDYHEPGTKSLLNGTEVSTNPLDGNAEISMALDNLFNHPNIAPFISYRLIQRLVTSNPSPEYTAHVATIFNDNGNGVKGDMKAVIKAILLHNEARNCNNCNDYFHGKLSEPFVRYMQFNKGINITSSSGNYRNSFYRMNQYYGQRPLAPRSVFNWFLPDYQPIGEIADNNKVAPEFQITNLQTIMGYSNWLQHMLQHDDIAEEWYFYGGEPEDNRVADAATPNYDEFLIYTDDDRLHILLDKLNLRFAAANIKASSLNAIKKATLEIIPWDNPNNEDRVRNRRLRFAILMVLTHPDYLITH